MYAILMSSFCSLQTALQTIYMLFLSHFLSPDYFANHPTCIYYAYACIPKTHNFGPMWQHQPLIIHDHQCNVLQAVVVKCWTQIQLHKVSLHLWCPTHGLEWKPVDVSIYWLVLRRQAPQGYAMLAILLNESEECNIIVMLNTHHSQFMEKGFKETENVDHKSMLLLFLLILFQI